MLCKYNCIDLYQFSVTMFKLSLCMFLFYDLAFSIKFTVNPLFYSSNCCMLPTLELTLPGRGQSQLTLIYLSGDVPEMPLVL